MNRDTYTIKGYEVKSGSVKPHGNGARVLVPRGWIGENVKIVKTTDANSSPSIQPTAVVMYEEAKSQDGLNIRSVMRKVVRYRNFTEVNEQIATDFNRSIDEINIGNELETIISEGRTEQLEEFYTDIIDNRNNKQDFIYTLKQWI